jgi:hypothetical protein
MRGIPGWLFFVGIIGMVVATVACALFAYATTRQAALSLAESGVEVGMTFDLFAQNQPTATPSPTPAPTDAPTLEPGITPTLTPTLDPALPTETPDPLAGLPELTDPRRKTILLMGIDERGRHRARLPVGYDDPRPREPGGQSGRHGVDPARPVRADPRLPRELPHQHR